MTDRDNPHVDALAFEVEEIANTWKGTNGGVYAIRGMSLGVARVIAPRIEELKLNLDVAKADLDVYAAALRCARSYVTSLPGFMTPQEKKLIEAIDRALSSTRQGASA